MDVCCCERSSYPTYGYDNKRWNNNNNDDDEEHGKSVKTKRFPFIIILIPIALLNKYLTKSVYVIWSWCRL